MPSLLLLPCLRIRGVKCEVDFVIVESPFATNMITLADGSSYEVREEDNVAYARACLHDCLVSHGEAPYASHLLYTQPGILDDTIPSERRLGIEAGLEIGRAANRRVFYLDRGFSSGMQWGLKFALEINQPCEIRYLGEDWDLGFNPGMSLDDLKAFLRD